MKIKTQPFYSLLLFFLFFSQLVLAQDPVTFTASTHTVESGDAVEVEFEVTNFIDIVSAQFTVDYDPTVLSFLDVDNLDLQYLTNDQFGTPPDIAEGKVTMAWFDQGLSGITVDDETVIFTLTFEVVGMPGDSSAITFGDDPTLIEVSNADGMVDDPGFEAGYVKVASISGVRKVVTDAFVFFPVAPNPVEEIAYLEFELMEGTQTRLLIYDLTGRPVFENTDTLQPGTHTVEIPAHAFPASGTYFCRLDAGGHTGIQKILVVR